MGIYHWTDRQTQTETKTDTLTLILFAYRVLNETRDLCLLLETIRMGLERMIIDRHCTSTLDTSYDKLKLSVRQTFKRTDSGDGEADSGYWHTDSTSCLGTVEVMIVELD